MTFIYFPPRLLQTDDAIANQHESLDNVKDRYLGEGVAILITEEQIKDVRKVIEFARQFESLREFPDA